MQVITCNSFIRLFVHNHDARMSTETSILLLILKRPKGTNVMHNI